MDCYLGLGSNQGDPSGNIRKAVQMLAGLSGISSVTLSPLYRTKPWGYADQPDFVNAVARAVYEGGIADLFLGCKRIESEMGRRPTFRNGPRIIDIDLLLCDGLIVQSATLLVPHPGVATRSFVLYPLCDLAPGFRHPLSGCTVEELKARLPAGEMPSLLED